MKPNEMMIGWTTTGTRADANRLARGLVRSRLAACAQVTGPVTSVYRWRKKLETAREFRLAVKFATSRSKEVSKWLTVHHPYENPQWVAVRVDGALKNYLKWVVDDPS